MIYAQVEPERIADVNWIMEGYEHLAMVSTVDGTSGLIKFYATPDTYFDTLDIIENMPFKVDVIDIMENGADLNCRERIAAGSFRFFYNRI